MAWYGPSLVQISERTDRRLRRYVRLSTVPLFGNGASAEGASEIAARAGGGLRRLRECMLGLVWAIPGSNFRENGLLVAKICPIEYSPFVRNGASAEGASKIAAQAGVAYASVCLAWFGPSLAQISERTDRRLRRYVRLSTVPLFGNGARASKIAARAGGRSRRLRECMLGLVWTFPGSNF